MKKFPTAGYLSGQTLLEVLVALGVATIVISAIVVIVISSLKGGQFSTSQNQANQYAQEGLEIVKNKAQSDWTTFRSYLPYSCLGQDQTISPPLGTSCGSNLGTFSREILFSHYVANDGNTDCLPTTVDRTKVTATVYWSDSKCPAGTPFCHKVQLISCLFKSGS
ncbi:MAG: hypothetical protein A2958_02755 [Candidatus Levybacteria bacterium RIFCSPLOWO2_01_FULL_38_13]|nr:MAG: hypothetical protein A2629_03170 [Candidatus Levybacteria bacterium RIFCSPHIGHO2_01_FULL_41_15]OGH35257.1 MAG: hypothetical protein A2958_02755 [Candidatus Levybacteria bacterium RIFCSPLOWO2_01_FULL_38_13]